MLIFIARHTHGGPELGIAVGADHCSSHESTRDGSRCNLPGAQLPDAHVRMAKVTCSLSSLPHGSLDCQSMADDAAQDPCCEPWNLQGFTHVYTVFHTQYHTVHYAAAWTADPSKARWYLHFNLVQMVRDSACEVF